MGSTVLRPHRYRFLKVPTKCIASNSSKHLFFFKNGHKGAVLRILHFWGYLWKHPIGLPQSYHGSDTTPPTRDAGEPTSPTASRVGTWKTGLPGLDSVTVTTGLSCLPLWKKNNMNHFFQEKDKKQTNKLCNICSIITRNDKNDAGCVS